MYFTSMYFTLYAVKRALFATAKGALTMAKEILGTEAAPNFIAALETTVAPYTTAIPDITAIPETNPDTMAIPETIAASDTTPASDTNPDTTAASDTNPDTTAAPDTTPDLMAASDTTPDTTPALDTHATSVSKDEDEFDNLVKEIEVDVHVDEEFEELFKNYERDEYYTDIVGLYFSQPSHPVLKVGNRRLVTPGAGDSLRDTKSIYEILADRKEWRVSHPGKIQPSFEHEISLYVKEYDFSFSKPEIKL